MLAVAVAVTVRFRQEATVPRPNTGGTSSIKLESRNLVWLRWMGCSVSVVDVRQKRHADRKADRYSGEEESVRR